MVASTAASRNPATVAASSLEHGDEPPRRRRVHEGVDRSSTGLQTQDIKDPAADLRRVGAGWRSRRPCRGGGVTVITFRQKSWHRHRIRRPLTQSRPARRCASRASQDRSRQVRLPTRPSRAGLNTGGALRAGSGFAHAGDGASTQLRNSDAAEGGAFGEGHFGRLSELSGASWKICLSEQPTAAAAR